MKLAKTLTALAIVLQAASHAMSPAPYNVCTYEMRGLPLIGPSTISLEGGATLTSPGAVVKYDEDGNISGIDTANTTSKFSDPGKIEFRGKVEGLTQHNSLIRLEGLSQHDFLIRPNSKPYGLDCGKGHATVIEHACGVKIIFIGAVNSLSIRENRATTIVSGDGIITLGVFSPPHDPVFKGNAVYNVMIRKNFIVSRAATNPGSTHHTVIYNLPQATEIIKLACTFGIGIGTDFLKSINEPDEENRKRILRHRIGTKKYPRLTSYQHQYTQTGTYIHCTGCPYTGDGSEWKQEYGNFSIKASANIIYDHPTGIDWVVFPGMGKAELTFQDETININILSAQQHKLTIQIDRDWIDGNRKSPDTIMELEKDLEYCASFFGITIKLADYNSLLID
jgi:hypothetical protein